MSALTVKTNELENFKFECIQYNPKIIVIPGEDGQPDSRSVIIYRSVGFDVNLRTWKELRVVTPMLYCPYKVNNIADNSVFKPTLELSFVPDTTDEFWAEEQNRFSTFLQYLAVNDHAKIKIHKDSGDALKSVLSEVLVFPSAYLTTDVMNNISGIINPPSMKIRVVDTSEFFSIIDGKSERITAAQVPKACYVVATIKLRWVWIGLSPATGSLMASNRYELASANVYKERPLHIMNGKGLIPGQSFLTPSSTGIIPFECDCCQSPCECARVIYENGSCAQPVDSDGLFDTLYQYHL